MRDAVIVSTARTPLTKAGRGSFNNTPAPTLGAFSVKAAVERAGLEGGEIDDVVFGAAMQQGSQTMNVARLIALRAGLPVPVPGMSIGIGRASVRERVGKSGSISGVAGSLKKKKKKK